MAAALSVVPLDLLAEAVRLELGSPLRPPERTRCPVTAGRPRPRPAQRPAQAPAAAGAALKDLTNDAGGENDRAAAPANPRRRAKRPAQGPPPAENSNDEGVKPEGGGGADAAGEGGEAGADDDSRGRGVRTGTKRGKYRKLDSAQKAVLEEAFKLEPAPDAAARKRLAEEVSCPEDQLSHWFRNRRTKRRKEEVGGPEAVPSPEAGAAAAQAEAAEKAAACLT
eukprot:CAMPEP_0183795412 /NCGR_PEP_ID=MMETSP0803_2-20130417/4406_1 /TAXON_ID=195967 /ORGANISM="Crustomastix stigmata, Strain CCMP3273" /LENGTH=223 /DNA_ID=CAMNT_0026039827 /DNA_START=12 /DNA_END=679 /DNA_ORIENTATION=+